MLQSTPRDGSMPTWPITVGLPMLLMRRISPVST
jgi:hypothetical protein